MVLNSQNGLRWGKHAFRCAPAPSIASAAQRGVGAVVVVAVGLVDGQ